MRKTSRRSLLLLAAIVTAVVAAACGSSGGSNSTGSSGSSTPAASTSTPSSSTPSGGSSGGTGGGLGSQSVTNYLSYTGGKSGPANSKLPPVTIGWVNQQGGQQVIGGLATPGAQLAVKYINQELGGVDGHPVQLATCYITSSDQEGTNCAQKFLANKSVDVIDEGAVAIGIQPLYSTLAQKKPVLVGVSATPVDAVQKNAVILFGDTNHVLGPIGTYATKVLHAKTAALIYDDIPGNTSAAAAIKAGLVAAGVKVKSVGYDPSDTSLTQPLEEAGASTADIVIPYTEAAGCVAIAKGLQQLGVTDGKKIVSSPLCLSAPVKQGLGDYPDWTYSIASSLFGDPTDPGMPAYMAVAKKYNAMADAPDPWFIVSFAEILSTVKFMNQVGYSKLSPSAILSTAKAFKGPQALGAPSLSCGQYSSAPAVCNNKAQFFLYSGKNKWSKVAGWTQPPAGDTSS